MVSILNLLLALVQAAPQAQTCADEWRALDNRAHRSRADSLALRDSLGASAGDCAQRVAAYLSAFLTRPGSDNWEGRFSAQQALEHVLQHSGLDARLTVALGYLRYQQGSFSDARRLLQRGRTALVDREPPPSAREQATVVYLLGRVDQGEWRDWRRFGELSPVSEGRWACEAYLQDLIAMSKRGDGALAAAAQLERPSPVDINVACSAQFETIMDDYFHLNADLNRNSRRDLETHFREAIALDAAYWPPYRELASEFAFEADWTRLEQLARAACQALCPDDHRPLLWLALATYREGDVAGAVSLFDSALALLPAEVRRWYHDPLSVLSIAEARALAEQPASVRAQWSEAFWRSRRVSYLTDGNDRLLEHYARLAEADLIFGIPSQEVKGWNTAPGSAWVRYGRPLKIRDLALENGRASFWTYGRDPDLVFTRMLTYEEYRVHQHVAPQLDLLHEKVPARFRPTGVDSVVSLEHQVARFRGDSGRVDLMVVAGPSERFAAISEGEAGVTLLNDEFTRVAQWRSRSVPRPGIAVTITGVRARPSHSVVVELLDREQRVLAQARDTITVTAPMPGPAVSDILLVLRVDGPDAALRRTDLTIEHLFGRTIEVGQDLGLVWEVYGLTTDASGAWRYRVALEVRDTEGRPLLTRLLRGPGRSGTRLDYERSALPVGDRTVEWVNLSGDWRAGGYEVVLRLEDLVGGGTATTTTLFGVRAGSAAH